MHCPNCETPISRMPNGEFYCPNLECEGCKPDGAIEHETRLRALWRAIGLKPKPDHPGAVAYFQRALTVIAEMKSAPDFDWREDAPYLFVWEDEEDCAETGDAC